MLELLNKSDAVVKAGKLYASGYDVWILKENDVKGKARGFSVICHRDTLIAVSPFNTIVSFQSKRLRDIQQIDWVLNDLHRWLI